MERNETTEEVKIEKEKEQEDEKNSAPKEVTTRKDELKMINVPDMVPHTVSYDFRMKWLWTKTKNICSFIQRLKMYFHT
ncbi:Hypothetical predicted protein [Octopus vulgaris]|uniref:Uncharacterized protein n=1 Tax=Octopus vulgaris TaxID=6645 RepID=A0AA36EZY9_OCTVU|nr:Hypothetical predicted protein [Octopus vulgaris]